MILPVAVNLGLARLSSSQIEFSFLTCEGMMLLLTYRIRHNALVAVVCC